MVLIELSVILRMNAHTVSSNKLIPILNNNETNEKECFPPITGGLSEFIVYSICLPNNEVWYNRVIYSIFNEIVFQILP